MSDQIDDIVENLKQPSMWGRILLMVGFAFVLYLLIVPAIIILTIAQALFAAITGDANRNLRGLGFLIKQYVSQIIDFVTYNSDERPFPFADFPSENAFEEAEKERKAGAPKKASVASTKKASQSSSEAPVAGSTSTTKKVAKKKAPAKKPAKSSASVEKNQKPASESDSNVG